MFRPPGKGLLDEIREHQQKTSRSWGLEWRQALQSPMRSLAFSSGWVNGLEERSDMIWRKCPQVPANWSVDVGGRKERRPDQLEGGIAVIRAAEGSGLH